MRKRITAMLLLVLGLGLLLAPSVALAEDVAPGDTIWGTVGQETTMNVTGDVTLTHRVEVKGTVTLNLGTNTTLTAPDGITVNRDNSLTITGDGTLIANENRVCKNPEAESTYGLAGIGSSSGNLSGNIIINSGTIVAYGGEGSYGDGTSNVRGGAGIGGAESSFGGTITINGGNVTAYGGGTIETGGAGIGGGNGAGGRVIINGGTVHAQGGAFAAAIGSGNGPSNQGDDDWGHKHTDVTIKGGVVSADRASENGTVSGDGVIGGDWLPGNVTVTITGGRVTGRIGTVNPDTGCARTTTVSLGWDTSWNNSWNNKDSDFVDASYPNVDTLTLTKDWRKDNDTQILTSDEVKAFGAQTKIVPYIPYTVQFDCAGGMPKPADQTVPEGMPATKPADPTKEGYWFDGWYNGDTEYDFSQAVASDLTLTARWIKTHTVSFNSNGGSAVASQTVEDGQQANKPEDPTRDKDRFDGWFADEKLTKAYDFSESVTADLTLYAKWTKLATLTFDLAGGTLDGKTGKITVEAYVGNTIKLPAAPTRVGYNFKCWKGSEYEAGADYEVAGDHEFTAEWERGEYPSPTMSNSRGGTFTSTSEEITYTVSQEVPDYAKSLRTWVDLEDVLQFSSDEVDVRMDDGTAVGLDVARVTIDGQRVTVEVDDATSLAGKTLQFSYKAKLRSGADLSPYMNSAGDTASVPYQAHTVFDGNEGDVKSSEVECVNFRVSKSSSGTSSTKASSSGKTLSRTGDSTSIAFVVMMAAAGAGLVHVGRKRR